MDKRHKSRQLSSSCVASVGLVRTGPRIHGDKRHDNVLALARKRIAEANAEDPEWTLLNFKEGSCECEQISSDSSKCDAGLFVAQLDSIIASQICAS